MATEGKTDEFVSLVSPRAKRPQPNALAGPHGIINILRDQFSISTWLHIGALLQGVLLFLFGKLALVPTVAILAMRLGNTIATARGWKSNPQVDGVIQKKFSAQFPRANGEYGSKPAKDEVVVFLLGTRCNHALGMLAPGFRDLSKHFRSMVKSLGVEEVADEFGFLGMTSWSNISDRKTNNELLQVSYWKSYDGLLRFAHSKHHSGGLQWWMAHVKGYPHLSIYHETYCVPRGHWESIYINSHATGLASTPHKTKTADGRDVFSSPVVDASGGGLKTSRDRMMGQ